MVRRFWMAATVAVVGMVTGASAWAAPVELKIKWPVGKRIDQRATINMTNAINMGGQSMQQVMQSVQRNAITVLKATPDGGRVLQYEITALKLSMTMGPQSFAFDSASDPAEDAGSPIAPMLRPMVGAKLLITVNADGEIQKVEGIDEMMERLPMAARGQMGQMFSEDSLKQMTGLNANQMLPEEAVSVGDTWKIDLSQKVAQLGGEAKMKGDATYKGMEMHDGRNCARIEFTSDFIMDAGEAGGPQGMTMSIDEGKSAGTYWFDPEAGRLMDMQVEQTMKVQMTRPGSPQGGITSQIKQQIQMETLKVEDAPQTQPAATQ